MGKGKPHKSPGTAGVDRPRTLAEMDAAGVTNVYFHDLAAAVRGLLPDIGDGSGRRCLFVLLVGGADGSPPRMISDIQGNREIRDFLAAIVRDIDSKTIDDGVLVKRDAATGALETKPMNDPDARQPLPPRQKFPKSWLPADYNPHEGEQ